MTNVPYLRRQATRLARRVLAVVIDKHHGAPVCIYCGSGARGTRIAHDESFCPVPIAREILRLKP